MAGRQLQGAAGVGDAAAGGPQQGAARPAPGHRGHDGVAAPGEAAHLHPGVPAGAEQPRAEGGEGGHQEAAQSPVLITVSQSFSVEITSVLKVLLIFRVGISFQLAR